MGRGCEELVKSIHFKKFTLLNILQMFPCILSEKGDLIPVMITQCENVRIVLIETDRDYMESGFSRMVNTLDPGGQITEILNPGSPGSFDKFKFNKNTPILELRSLVGNEIPQRVNNNVIYA